MPNARSSIDACHAVELQTFGGEALDTDVVGYAMVLEVPIPDVMEQRAEVEGQVSLIDFEWDGQSTIKDQSEPTPAPIVIENLGPTALCEDELQEIQFALDALVEMGSGETVRVAVDGRTQSP